MTFTLSENTKAGNTKLHTDLKASDGYLVHGVVDRLDDVQHGG